MSEVPAAAAESSRSSTANGNYYEQEDESVEQEPTEKKIEVITSDEKQGCATFVIRNEDHTIGNSVRYTLMKDPRVSFAGYSVPHPSKPVMNLRVQAVDMEDDSAVELLKDALDTLASISDHVKDTFESAVEAFDTA
eukprot:CAMPEP_0177632426 /NCGR_PEP_ID=MMETSP0447-20121125/2284_1 /TAXON_ID=0 /ORGANISM="Stygamoeba regulata, Strain BSH-02190019" /LENGTH=136 /DNA_ID=CAMNT_0019133991 /DNA_START=87 /DNA_END=497 /DNA_ORIENTATION=-